MKNKTEADLCSWSRKSKISGHKMKLKRQVGARLLRSMDPVRELVSI